MTTFQISGYLTEFTGGRAEIKIDGSPATVGEALQQLWNQHVGLQDRVLTEQGQIRPHVNIFVNSETVRRDQVLQTPLSGDGDICIMPAVSGGAQASHGVQASHGAQASLPAVREHPARAWID